MKPEALDAFATQSTRPGALEAAAASQDADEQIASHNSMATVENPHQADRTRPHLSRLNTPIGQHTDGTETAAKAVEGVVESVKAVVHEAVVWTERKAEELAHADARAGPYESPATAAGGVSDLDGIAMGVLPATVAVQEDGDGKGQEGVGEKREEKGNGQSRL